MSATASTLNISGTINAQNGGTINYAPAAIVNQNGNVGQEYQLPLTTEPVEVTLPANTQWFGVVPPYGNTIGLHHKWASGDTGSKVNAQIGMPCVGVDSSQLSFCLWADSALTVTIYSG